MDIKTLVEKVIALVAAMKVGDYLGAIKIILEIIAAISSSVAGPPDAMHGSKQAATAIAEASSVDSLVGNLEAFASAHHGESDVAPVDGRVIDVLLPILMALLKKFLGL